ncbi:hypothetical protein BC835DRAFT_1410507 [Cytidiella melzeri]|nr:hypothetical protein BC835DRAFT_1410507 [Cytidiella melzeri]
MKSFAVVAALVACAFAQRLHIVSPTDQTTVSSGSAFIAELHQDQTLSSLSQVSVTISLTACYDVCDDPSQWGPGTVLYNGAFNPQYNQSQPQKGLYQDFSLTVPQGWPAGESVLQVGHLFKLGAVQFLVSDYTDVHFTVSD